MYRFNNDFAKSVIKALGLEGQRVRKIVLTMEINQPITLQWEGYASLESQESLPNTLVLATWHEEQPSPVDGQSGPKDPNHT